ncbi:MAG: hypothetical protein QOE46_1802 [Acidobacteriota bacterium]|jgi:hypothetical protein|nr:hypothetical protein [Acidobacteriota bacterium]
MTTSKKTQAKAGAPPKRRGQQMGDERSKADKTHEVKRETPALSGRRKTASKFYADDSAQHTGTRDETARDNSPSVPAAIPTDMKLGESGGEAEFKARQKTNKRS